MESVFFRFDEYSISETSKPSLQNTSECIKQGKTRTVLLNGYTDEQGTDEYNIALSEKRGRSAADYLARLGIDPMLLQVVPKGESQTQGGDQDRRVDFEWK